MLSSSKIILYHIFSSSNTLDFFIYTIIHIYSISHQIFIGRLYIIINTRKRWAGGNIVALMFKYKECYEQQGIRQYYIIVAFGFFCKSIFLMTGATNLLFAFNVL